MPDDTQRNNRGKEGDTLTLEPGYERYEHHGVWVTVKTELKGKHREHCLCWTCKRFVPEDREKNCPIANMLFSLCVLVGLTTPVWECPQFGLKKGEVRTTVGKTVALRNGKPKGTIVGPGCAE